MKINFDKKLFIQIGYHLILLAIAPFAFEVLILADYVVDIEFVLTFMLLYFRTAVEDIIVRCYRLKHAVYKTIDTLSEMFIFQPKNDTLHASASCFVIVFMGSTLMASALWLPIIALNSSGFC